MMVNNTAHYRRFSTLLVANRGEIALRIIVTAKQQGYRTVAIYSPVDANSPHVAEADLAVQLTGNSIDQSYLDSEQVFAAAKASGADAIHPGYGFFSENSAFAQRCLHESIVFIGPNPDTIETMGNKRQAKLQMQAAGVPCVPGFQGEDQSNATLLAAAESIGWPVMIKASAGGGGRGMRLVHQATNFIEQLTMARNEALNAFGNDEIILEKALVNARHIEIQVFGDCFGHVIHLGERDCSLQRRHQKVVEEAPSPAVDETLRKTMGAAAICAAKACNYVGAGTIEFMLASDGAFYFLEMNTRLQVEHPVTEFITGIDLVDWQLQIAAGYPLPKTQSDITLQGHAIEVRLYAEDPAEQFLPQTGQIDAWVPAQNAGIRIDAGIVSGQNISPYYDSMLAKVIAFGENRETARRRLILSLDQTLLTGIRCNKEFLSLLLQDDTFSEGKATTDYIDHQLDINTLLKQPTEHALLSKAVAAVFLINHSSKRDCLKNWTNGLYRTRKLTLKSANKTPFTVHVNSLSDGYRCMLDNESVSLKWLAVQHCSANSYRCVFSVAVEQSLSVDQVAIVYYEPLNGFITVSIAGRYNAFHDDTLTPPTHQTQTRSGTIVAPMDGSIFQLLTSEGSPVKTGQTLATLEAMKMEHPLKANCDGVVKSLLVTQGEQVRIRQTVIVITPNP